MIHPLGMVKENTGTLIESNYAAESFRIYRFPSASGLGWARGLPASRSRPCLLGCLRE